MIDKPVLQHVDQQKVMRMKNILDKKVILVKI